MAAPAETAVPGALEPVSVALPGATGRGGQLREAAGIWVPGVLILLIFGLCFVWPLIGPVPSSTGGNILNSNLPSFSPGHLLGTDATGNDVWSRLLYGGRASLEVALAVNAIGISLGGLLGAFAAYFAGWRDAVTMRILDVLIAFPSLVLAVAIAERLGPSEVHTIWALTVFSVPAFARLSRAATLRVREQTFIVAARLSGTRSPRILGRRRSCRPAPASS